MQINFKVPVPLFDLVTKMRNGEPTDKSRIEGVAGQGERARSREVFVVKAG